MSVDKNNVVVVEREFNAPVAKVFNAIKEGRLFFNCGAWADSAIDARVGGKYRLNFEHYGNTFGEFTEIVENKRLAFTWNSDRMDVKTSVTIDFFEQGSGCKVTLRQEGFINREFAEMHEGGWTSGLAGFNDEIAKFKIAFDRGFKAPVEMLYDACAGMRFFSLLGTLPKQSTVDFRIGGRYKCDLENGQTIEGEFLEIEKNKKIVFTWEKAPCGHPLSKTTQVTMNFGSMDGDGEAKSYLEMIHEGFTDHEAAEVHHSGWNATLHQVYKQTSR